MPCYDHRVNDDYRQACKDLNERTAMLCAVCRTLEQEKLLYLLSLDVQKWWEGHKGSKGHTP
jgi:hypothetical protein